MSISILFEDISEEVLNEIESQCKIKPASTQYEKDPEPVVCYSLDVNTKKAFIPMGMGATLFDSFPNMNLTHSRTTFTSQKTPFTRSTDPKKYRDQDVVMKEALLKLQKNNSVFLALATGFGKTTLGNILSARLGYKTCVLCHLDIVLEQWVSEFEQWTNAKVQRVKGNKLDPNADIYVIGIRKVANMDSSHFADIGTVIIDETHISTITAFTNSLLKFTPKYIIGLSATRKRNDGMHKLLNLYFGEDSEFIERSETKDFRVIKVETNFEPTVEYTQVRGDLVVNWTKVVNSIAYIPERHILVANIVKAHPNDVILILSDRVEQSKSMYALLKERGESVSLLVEKTKDWDKTCRILVAGTKKAGVGFDDPRLTMLIMMSDTKKVEQYEGRIRCTNNIIYDIVDKNNMFENHWKIRMKWYIQRGAKIEVKDSYEFEEN